MVRSRRSGNFGEIVVTERVLAREGEISRDIVLRVLHPMCGIVGSAFPCLMVMLWITWRWILGRIELRTICARKGAKVVVKRVVLLNDDYYMINSVSEFA